MNHCLRINFQQCVVGGAEKKDITCLHNGCNINVPVTNDVIFDVTSTEAIVQCTIRLHCFLCVSTCSRLYRSFEEPDTRSMSEQDCFFLYLIHKDGKYMRSTLTEENWCELSFSSRIVCNETVLLSFVQPMESRQLSHYRRYGCRKILCTNQ